MNISKRFQVLAILIILVLSNIISVAYATNNNSYGTSDVTLFIESTGSPSRPGSDGHGGTSGNRPGRPINDDKEPEKPVGSGDRAGGEDLDGNSYYLRPGIHINDNVAYDGYIVGRNNWKYAPAENLTRAEFATILNRVFRFDNTDITKTFEDTKGHWAEEAINILASNGIVYGVNSREFNPDGSITRGQVLLMLSRILYTDQYSSYYDLDQLRTHYEPQTIARILNAGIYDQIDTAFNLYSTIKREEIAHLVNNIIYKRGLTLGLAYRNLFITIHEVYSDIRETATPKYYNSCLKSLDMSWLTDKLYKYKEVNTD